jgi:hypothetical protein
VKTFSLNQCCGPGFGRLGLDPDPDPALINDLKSNFLVCVIAVESLLLNFYKLLEHILPKKFAEET